MKIEDKIAATIKRIMKEKGVTHDELATALGVSRPTLTQILNGKIGMGVDRMHAIANFLQIDPTSLNVMYSNEGDSYVIIANDTLRKIPHLSLEKLHNWSYYMEQMKDKEDIKYIYGSHQGNEPLFYFDNDNEIFSPKIEKGDQITVQPGKEPKDGSIVICQINGIETNLVRKYMTDGLHVYLKSNDNLPMQSYIKEQVKIIAVVVAVTKNFS